IEEVSTVPVGFEAGVNGSYTFRFEGINTFDPTSYIYLEDKKLDVRHNVRSGAYTFTANATDHRDRFVLHFTPAAAINATEATCTDPAVLHITQAGSASWNYSLMDHNNIVISSGWL